MRPVRAPRVSVPVTHPKPLGTGVPGPKHTHKRCPWCDNLVEKITALCRSCGFKFDRPEFMKRCPSCSDIIFAFSVLCPTCRFDVHSYYEKLAGRAHRVEQELERVVRDRIAPELREIEERAEEAGHRIAARMHVPRSLHLMHCGAPPGTRCFRCGAGVRVGSTRCAQCKVRIVLG
jgi:hypothetical protein